MDTLIKRLEYAIKLNKTNKSKLSLAIGKSKDTVRKILDGSTRNPTADTLTLICNKLGINLLWLVDGEGEMEATSENDAAEYHIIHGIIKAGRDDVMIDMSDSQIMPKLVMVTPETKTVFMQISGDSMAPKYEDGEILEFGRIYYDAAELKNSKAWVTLDTGEELFKIIKDGTVPNKYTLLSLNPKYDPLINVTITKARPLVGVRYWNNGR